MILMLRIIQLNKSFILNTVALNKGNKQNVANILSAYVVVKTS